MFICFCSKETNFSYFHSFYLFKSWFIILFELKFIYFLSFFCHVEKLSITRSWKSNEERNHAWSTERKRVCKEKKIKVWKGSYSFFCFMYEDFILFFNSRASFPSLIILRFLHRIFTILVVKMGILVLFLECVWLKKGKIIQ